MISSAVITHLLEHAAVTIYYYFDFNDSEAARASSFLRSILRQLLPGLREIPSALRELYQKLSEHQQLPNVNELLDTVFRTTPLVGQPIYLVIDALDESMDQDLLFIMKSLERMIRGWEHLSLLFTTRQHFVVSDYLENFTAHKVCISEQKQNQDIKEYISFRLRDDKRMAKWPSETKEEVLQTLTQDAAGM